MLKIKRFLNRSYLFLLVAVISCVVIPVLIGIFVFHNQSFNRLMQSNNAYYNNVIEDFGIYFSEQIDCIKSTSYKLYLNSGGPSNSLYDSVRELEESTLIYPGVMQVVQRDYNLPVSDFCLYYPELDIVITKQGQFTFDKYSRENLNYTDEENESKITSALHSVNFRIPNLTYVPVQEEDGSTSILIIYSARFGKNDDEINLLYLIKKDTYLQKAGKEASERGTDYYVFDKDGEILFTTALSSDNFDSDAFYHASESEPNRQNMRNIYTKTDEKREITYMIFVGKGSLQDDIASYYRKVVIFQHLFSILLLLMVGLALFLAYRPVHRITSKLGIESGNEFLLIQNELDIRSQQILKQENIIMDAILNNLVYDVPFPTEGLGTPSGLSHVYQTYILKSSAFRVQEQEELRSAVNTIFSGRLYVNDLLGEDRYLLVVFIKEEKLQEFIEWLFQTTADLCEEDRVLHQGEPVHDLNCLKDSYLSCYDAAKDKEQIRHDLEAMNLDKRRVQTTECIRTYIDQNFRDSNLSQSMVADALHVSNYTISRLFKSQIGIGFSEYVNVKRLEYAKSQLENTNLSVGEIAENSGFSNFRYFSRLFRTHYGITPTEYRNGKPIILN